MLPRFQLKSARLAFPLIVLLVSTGSLHPIFAQESDALQEMPEPTNLLEDVTSFEIPRKRVRGQLAGDSLKIRSAVIEGDELVLREGTEGEGSQVRITLYTEPSDSLVKRQFLVEPLDQLGVPTITVVTDQGEEEHLDGYGMKLQFAKIKEGKITGRIHLVLPDGESRLTGYFKAPYEAPSFERAEMEFEPIAPADSGLDESQLGQGMADQYGGGEMPEMGDLDLTGAGAVPMGGPFAMGGPLGIVVLALIGIGWLVTMVGGVWMMVNAFKTSLLWGLAYLFLPFASLVWMVMHWAEAKKPFMVSLAGCAVMLAGLGVGVVLG